mmetsp:Transcript_137972/g.349565  ORF Transcript_137972/g.349565 Transcript_137972/m.349565 type:complete len:399 (+) Transcript_137972:66-1262(+)
MEQHLLNAQALAAARFEMASAPPLPCAHQESMVREHVESIELVQGGLVELGVPRGLAGVVAQDDKRIGLRVYLLDNSGSTSQPDGSVVQQGADGRLRQRPCTRWEEICAFAEDHARWNLKVGTPCEFILLNSMGRTSGSPMVEGRDCIHIDRSHGPETSQLQELRELLMNNGPRGVTPISERLEDIRRRIQADFSALAQARQMIFLTIVTDGLPTSPSSGQSGPADRKVMIEMMRSLCASLPVQLVIRLCTDEEQTIDFYNNIDEELELPLDILDDISGEAREVAKHGNDWFAYTPVLHRIREAGTLSKMLDAIDERPLSVLEVQQFAELLCGSQRPLAGLGKRQFVNEIQEIVAQTPLVYDARRQEMRPIVDIPKLRIAMRVGFRGVVLPVICPCLL